jgi:hypothetical protein
MIDKATHEIRQDDDKTVYKSLEEIADDLPDHSPRYILLSYPLTLVCRQRATQGPLYRVALAAQGFSCTRSTSWPCFVFPCGEPTVTHIANARCLACVAVRSPLSSLRPTILPPDYVQQ